MLMGTYTLEIFFFIIFCLTAWTSIQKYLSYKISITVKEEKMKEKEFPSISVCPHHALKENLENVIFKNESLNAGFTEIERLLISKTWKRNETFYFVSYPSHKDPGNCCFKYLIDNFDNCFFLGYLSLILLSVSFCH